MVELTNNGWCIKAKQKGIAYSSSYAGANTTLEIDARGDRVYISMEEYRIESNRMSGASITLTREEWNKIKELIKETGGEL